jgi:hypothetical protein
MTPRTAEFGTSNSLGDYSSRNNNAEGEILKVPIDNNTDECFLIANRRKISKWDRIMLGDTAQIDSYNDYTDYGKRIYIYHIKNGVHFPQTTNDTVQDLECADGYWEWELKSTVGIAKVPFDCFVSNPGWRVYQKKNVLYTNDPSTLGQAYGQGNLGNPNPWGDGVSFFYRYNDTPRVSQWSVGDETTTPCMLGTDRIYTNEEEYYFNYERAGDRWDAWNVGYNEIFSPYSSPNTFSWNNDTTGIFIWYNNLNGNTASIIVERAEEYGGDKPLQEILAETPPSRPMGIKIDITDCIDGKIFPVIIWNHNMEPDMTHYLGENEYKTYKIYRAFTDINSVPGNYEEIATVNIHPNDIPTYIDYNTYVQCDEGVGSFNVRVRYRVQAVDIFNDMSVLSDFVSISTYLLQKGEGDGGNALHRNLAYKLEQNYPNPFNPVTNIQYSIPKEGLVSLKVYDVLGREVKSLVNEFKQAGSYIVSFDGSELSSGIYFYRIHSGDFVQVKRMVLIK